MQIRAGHDSETVAGVGATVGGSEAESDQLPLVTRPSSPFDRGQLRGDALVRMPLAVSEDHRRAESAKVAGKQELSQS
jgi:hypothetical protein